MVNRTLGDILFGIALYVIRDVLLAELRYMHHSPAQFHPIWRLVNT